MDEKERHRRHRAQVETYSEMTKALSPSPGEDAKEAKRALRALKTRKPKKAWKQKPSETR